MLWKMAWSYQPINHNTCIGTITNTTLRGFFKNNLNGNKLRIRFSNPYSPESLIFDHVTIGKRISGDIEGFHTVRYKGNELIKIEPGDVFTSDEIDMDIKPGEDIVLSIYIKDTANIYCVCSTWSAKSWNTKYGIGKDYTLDKSFPETDNYDIYPVLQYDVNRANHIFGISAIEVLTDDNVKTMALFGDSITHMSYYSDVLTDKIIEKYPGKITIVNRGIGGNRLLHDYTRLAEIPSGGTIFGGPGIERFERDIYRWDVPDYVVVLIGINDFTHPYFFNRNDEIITLEEYKKGLLRLIDLAHSKGSKIYIGTVIPFKKDKLEWFDEVESLRNEANEWIRKQKEADGYIDFDLAVRDADDPEKIDDTCHIGDGIHPNEEGGKRMAYAVPLELLLKED